MRKSKPVIILVAIQLAFLLILTSIPYIRDAVIKAKGDVYTFEIEEVFVYGMASENLTCKLKYSANVDCDSIYVITKQYATVKTNKNGISYIADVSDNKPDGVYLGNKTRNKNVYDHFDYKIPESFFYSEENQALFPDYFAIDKKHTVTADVYIYEGYLLPKQLYINGIPIEEFTETEKINESGYNQLFTAPDRQPAY